MIRAAFPALLLLLGSAVADERKDDSVDFVRDIQPIFKARCLKCHSTGKKKGNFRLDSKAHALRGGIHGKAILPGKAKDSPLIGHLTTDDASKRMPKGDDPLPPKEIATLIRWIDTGAPWPDSASVTDPKIDHWAYKKPVRPEPPKVKNAAWVRNAIDDFIAARHEKAGLTPRPEAPKRLLLRRLYLDVIGLPPTREETDTFLADDSSQAYESVVDRLLDDPRYGERWGRHWMDVWRYADWGGWRQEVRYSQKHIWRWRDWIVESVNDDKGYDQMILEMLAGDEIAPEDPKTLRATGFLVRNWFKFNRNIWLQDTIEHTSKAFLGTTMNCARCHDHFYDPISHDDYYRFRAFFEPHNIRTDRVPGAVDVAKAGLPRAYDKDINAKTYLFIRGQDTHPDKSREMAPDVPAELGGSEISVKPVSLPRTAAIPHRRPFVIKDDLEASRTTVENARKKADAALEKTLTDDKALAALPSELLEFRIAEANHAALEALLKAEALEKTSEAWKKAALKAQAAQRRSALLTAKKNLLAARRAKKDVEKARKALAKAEAESKKPPSTKFTPRKVATYPATSTGRRRALAAWIASKDNPLTARVAVNQIWMRHFGNPLVSTVFDFGLQGTPPTHPGLLDWLAVEFMEQGWSMKKLHRLILTSSAYRMASTPDPEALARDRENTLLWRMNSRRMEAELVRDSILYVCGELDLKRGGPDIAHEQGLTVPRRSIYFQHAREKQMVFLELFDMANLNECYERTTSVVPQQALALANSSLVLEKSRLLAGKLVKRKGDFVAHAFERILGRAPSKEEHAQCTAFLSEQKTRLAGKAGLTPFTGGTASKVKPSADPAQRARENLVQVLLNHTEFVTIR